MIDVQCRKSRSATTRWGRTHHLRVAPSDFLSERNYNESADSVGTDPNDNDGWGSASGLIAVDDSHGAA
jgi:hypothetical protein